MCTGQLERIQRRGWLAWLVTVIGWRRRAGGKDERGGRHELPLLVQKCASGALRWARCTRSASFDGGRSFPQVGKAFGQAMLLEKGSQLCSCIGGVVMARLA